MFVGRPILWGLTYQVSFSLTTFLFLLSFLVSSFLNKACSSVVLRRISLNFVLNCTFIIPSDLRYLTNRLHFPMCVYL